MNDTTPTATTTISQQPLPPSTLRPRLRYAPPWPELSPRADYWYWRLEQVITAGLWIAKKLGRIEGYFMTDVLGPLPRTWPESLDGKHFGVYTIEGSDRSRFYKIWRLVVIVDLTKAESGTKAATGGEQ